MDLKIAIARIYDKAKYKLSSSVPPHKIIEWRDPRPKPSEAGLEASWASYEEEQAILEQQKQTAINDIVNRGTQIYLYIDGEDMYYQAYFLENE